MGLNSVESGLMVHLQRELYDLEVSDFNQKWNITDNEASIIMNWFQIRIDELKEKEKLQAGIAQLVEQLICNHQVASSNLAASTIYQD